MEEKKEIKDFKALKFLDKFRNIFEKTGVNYPIMRRLLQLMLIMDGRKTITAVVNRNSAKKDKDSNPFTGYLISYGFIGFFIMILMFLPFSLFYKMSLCFGMIIFMLMTTMISDFSSILLDVRDKIILVPKPIDSKTMNTAKTLHIIIYTLVITSAIAGPAAVVGTFKYGLAFLLIFILQLFFVIAFVIFLTSIFYFAILQFFDGEKLKDVINYFQILLSLTMTIGYQFIGRVFDLFKTQIVFTPKWWTYILPPVWFAAPYSYLLEDKRQLVYGVLSLIGILVPLMLFFLYYIRISSYFEKNLQKLSTVGTKKSAFIEKNGVFRRKVLRILCPEKTENIFFRFTNNMISNERQLKLKLYPNLAYAAIFPFIFLFNVFTNSKSFTEAFTGISKSAFYLNIYFAVMLLSALYTTIYTSEKYKGAWIYRLLPLKDPSPIYKGSLKCFLLKYVFPVFFLTGLVFSLFYGVKIIPHLFVMFLNLIILTLVVVKISNKNLPFSMEFFQQNQEASKGVGCLVLIVNGIYCGISALIEYFVSRTNYGIYIYMAVLLTAVIVMWNTMLRIKWLDVLKSAE